MALRGFIVGPMVSLIIGIAISNLPIGFITESKYYKQDVLGIRTAVSRAYDHILWSINVIKSKVTITGNTFMKNFYSWTRKDYPVSGDKRQHDKRKSDSKEKNPTADVFSRSELAEYSGADPDKGPYLAILGQVFDVSRGRRHYAPGGGYAFFSGRDASRAFVSGDFSETGLTDDLDGLSHQDCLGLDKWLDTYRADYRYVGHLEGRFYTATGQPTDYLKNFSQRLAEARRERANDDYLEQIFPPCNSEWSQDRGGRVYCTDRSGGKRRQWVGVPREFFSGGKKRCACVRDSGSSSFDGDDAGSGRGDLDNPQLREYPSCSPAAVSCKLK